MAVILNIDTRTPSGRMTFITNVVLSQKGNFYLKTIYNDCKSKGADIQISSIALCMRKLEASGEIVRNKDDFSVNKSLLKAKKSPKKVEAKGIEK